MKLQTKFNPHKGKVVVLKQTVKKEHSFHIAVHNGTHFVNEHTTFNNSQVLGWRYPTTPEDKIFVKSRQKGNQIIEEFKKALVENNKTQLLNLNIWNILSI